MVREMRVETDAKNSLFDIHVEDGFESLDRDSGPALAEEILAFFDGLPRVETVVCTNSACEDCAPAKVQACMEAP